MQKKCIISRKILQNTRGIFRIKPFSEGADMQFKDNIPSFFLSQQVFAQKSSPAGLLAAGLLMDYQYTLMFVRPRRMVSPGFRLTALRILRSFR